MGTPTGHGINGIVQMSRKEKVGDVCIHVIWPTQLKVNKEKAKYCSGSFF